MRLARQIWTFAKSVAVTAAVGVTFADCVGYPTLVNGMSMQPTLNHDLRLDGADLVWLNKRAVRNFDVDRGQVVVLMNPRDPDHYLIKRIIGLEGDLVQTLSYKRKFVRVPEGHIWVEGDHHRGSLDSNVFGPVPVGLVTARVSAILWPLRRFGPVYHGLTNRKPVKIGSSAWHLDDESDYD